MQQANALRRLEMILDEAVTNENKNQQSGLVLLKVMKLEPKPQNIIFFYELLNIAKEEATRLKDLPKIQKYLDILEELHQVFVVNHIWETPWNTFTTHIEIRSVLIALDALANYFHDQNPAIHLEQEFLKKLNSEFEALLDNILNSDLSKELKRFLERRIGDILTAIRRYHIDGTQGLEKAAQSLVSNLVMTEHKFTDLDKKNPIYTRTKAWALSLVLFFVPTSAYDIIGAAPDIQGFWIPKFEELVAGQKKIEHITCETPNIQGILEKAADIKDIFDRQPQKSMSGNPTPKALPASKDASEDTFAQTQVTP